MLANDAHDLVQQLHPKMPGPGELFEGLWHEAVDRDPLLDLAADDARAIGSVHADQGLHRLFEVADGGRNAPDLHRRREGLELGDGQFHLDAALVAQQVVPFVDHNGRQPAEPLVTALLGEQHVQALRGRDQHLWKPPVLTLLLGRRGVPGAHLHRPARILVRQQPGGRPVNFLGQSADRRDPQHPQPTGLAPSEHRRHQGAVRLATARRRIDQGIPARLEMAPRLQLKWKRRPTAAGKESRAALDKGIQRPVGRLGIRRIWRGFHPAIISRIAPVFLPFPT